MSQKQLKREDFSYEVNARGYILKYRGQSIGGTGILSSARGPRGRAVPKQIADYCKIAEITIQSIINGNPGRIYKEAIDQINKSEGV